MRAGLLRDLITLRRATITRGLRNAPVEAWRTIGRVRAAVEYVSDGEKTRAGETSAVILCRFQVRRTQLTEGLTVKDQLQFKGRTFNVTGTKPVDGRFGIEISAQARAE